MIEYALCWDLSNGEEKLKSLFQKFQDKHSNTIYKNLYDYHVLEKPSMSFDKSKTILNKLKKINNISWLFLSYKISNNRSPRISMNLILTPLSLMKIFINGYFPNPFYSLTIAAHDTKHELIEDYEKIMFRFLKNNVFSKLNSSKLSLIEYESGNWEKKIE